MQLLYLCYYNDEIHEKALKAAREFNPTEKILQARQNNSSDSNKFKLK